MSLMSIDEVVERDPNIDPIDVTRLMFHGVKETVRHPPKPEQVKSVVGSLIDEGPIVGVITAVFLILTVPIGGIAEAAVRGYRATKEGKSGVKEW